MIDVGLIGFGLGGKYFHAQVIHAVPGMRLAAILQGRKYEGLTLVKYVFPDQNHCEVAAPGFQAGLKFALKK